MKLIVNAHQILIDKGSLINEKEINVNKVEFEFDEEIPDDYTKEAYFTIDGNAYKVIINNNECNIPSEVLEKKGTFTIGVVAYKTIMGEYQKRFNPTPITIQTLKGSLTEAENSEEPTPSEVEQLESLVNQGLTEINAIETDLQQKVDSGYFKGDKGDTGERGPQGIQGERGLQGEQGIQGIQGEKGDKGDKGDTGPAGRDGTNGTNGTNGRDGYVQYTAGNNITIENNVISATGGGETSYFYVNDNSSSNPFTFENKKAGVYVFYNPSNSQKIYFRYSQSSDSTDLYLMGGLLLMLIEPTSETSNNTPIAMYIDAKNGNTTVLLKSNNTLGFVTMNFDTRINDYYVLKKANQTLTYKYTFTGHLPESSLVPTTDSQLVNKKYVDDNMPKVLFYIIDSNNEIDLTPSQLETIRQQTNGKFSIYLIEQTINGQNFQQDYHFITSIVSMEGMGYAMGSAEANPLTFMAEDENTKYHLVSD